MSVFQFKHFQIQQQHAALKVGTDAMILGAFCHWDAPGKLLDIGTGTGVLTLMCAQRFPFREITGLEISEEAVRDAQINAQNNPFDSPISIVHQAVQDFQPDHLFDAIISNPPFFENSLPNEDAQKSLARHTASLPFPELIRHIDRLLTPEGSAWIIVPDTAEIQLETLASKNGLFIKKKIHVEGKPGKHVRTIYCFSRIDSPAEISEFTIRTDSGTYSDAYKVLTKEFHNKALP
ncbi:methyltransferase [Fluviicola sp.]|uniref:tRNA1(Val) (adenine(37)-N6)-methyltransferase n=1 Tax=Fluviicola sp. TaxID=1917219 RepID=UPI0031DAF551